MLDRPPLFRYAGEHNHPRYRFMRASVLLLTGLLLAAPELCAQILIYPRLPRPADVDYRAFTTEHFYLIYPAGHLRVAREAAAWLEAGYDSTAARVGPLQPGRIPVVLNAYNDRSNGYVTPLPLKEEIELPGLKGRYLSPRHHSWLEVVLTHETTHALHGAVRAPAGIGYLVGLFGPDANPLLNLGFTPPGISEGIAVLRESEPLLSGGPAAPGRLHFSFFRMRFRAAMHHRRPWSLSEILEPSAYSYPIDRHYIGGTFFLQYLQEHHGEEAFRTLALRFNRFPLLGYGVTLAGYTHTWPWKLGRAFQQAVQDSLRGDEPAAEWLRLDRRGLFLYRPRWLDSTRIAVYVAPESYDHPAGMYVFDTATGDLQPMAYETLTEDHYFSLDPDGKHLYFSRYHLDPLIETRAIADIYALDLSNRRVRRITDHARLFAPVATGNALLALANRPQFSDIIRIDDTGNRRLSSIPRSDFRELLPTPDGHRLFALLNVAGHQGIAEVLMAGDTLRLEPFLFFEEASIFSPSWSSDGKYLLFTADPEGQPEIFALEMETGTLLQVTHSRFGAFDASLSPDGRHLACIDYRHERHRLIVQPFRPETYTRVDRPRWRPSAEAWRQALTEPPFPLPEVTPRPYRSGLSWLVPRFWGPTVTDEAPGLLLAGTEPLQRWSQALLLYVKEDGLWGSWMMQTTAWPLRPFVYTRYRPERQAFRWRTPQDPTPRPGHVQYGTWDTGLGVAFPLWLYTSTYRSDLFLTLTAEVERRYERAVEPSFIELPRDRFPRQASRLTLQPGFQLRYRLRRTLRDLRVHTGTILIGSAIWSIQHTGLPRERTAAVTLYQYLPVWLRKHHSLRLHLGYLQQASAGYRDFQAYAPRGYEDFVFPDRRYYRMGAEYLLPLAYVDRGLVLIPFYVEALYLYGFLEHMRSPVGDELPERPATWLARATSAGGGLGARIRLLYNLRLDLRAGLAYRMDTQDWTWIWR